MLIHEVPQYATNRNGDREKPYSLCSQDWSRPIRACDWLLFVTFV